MLVNAVTASLICSPSTEIPLPQCFDVLIKHCRGRLVKKRSRALSPLLFLSDRVQCVVAAGGASRPAPLQAPKMTRKVVSVQPSPFYTHVTGSVTDCHVPFFFCPSLSTFSSFYQMSFSHSCFAHNILYVCTG